MVQAWMQADEWNKLLEGVYHPILVKMQTENGAVIKEKVTRSEAYALGNGKVVINVSSSVGDLSPVLAVPLSSCSIPIEVCKTIEESKEVLSS
jgi:hypothetical protein